MNKESIRIQQVKKCFKKNGVPTGTSLRFR